MKICVLNAAVTEVWADSLVRDHLGGCWSFFCVIPQHVLQWKAQCLQKGLEGGGIQGQKGEGAPKLLPYCASEMCGYKWSVQCFRASGFLPDLQTSEPGWTKRLELKDWERGESCKRRPRYGWVVAPPELPQQGCSSSGEGWAQPREVKVLWVCSILLLLLVRNSWLIKPTSRGAFLCSSANNLYLIKPHLLKFFL